MQDNQGASQATGLAGAGAPEPRRRLGPAGGIPCAEEISEDEWEIIHSLSNVTIGQVSDGGPLYWGVWDQNMRNDEEDFGWVHIGREVKFDGERYEPISAAPGETHWAWQQARARAVLRLFDCRPAIAIETQRADTGNTESVAKR